MKKKRPFRWKPYPQSKKEIQRRHERIRELMQPDPDFIEDFDIFFDDLRARARRHDVDEETKGSVPNVHPARQRRRKKKEQSAAGPRIIPIVRTVTPRNVKNGERKAKRK